MTDPDEFVGSEADRRFREELRTRLEAAAREDDQGGDAQDAGTGSGDVTAASSATPPRSRLDVFMDWAPLGVGLLAVAAIAVIALYGMNGGDLGPW
jgi:hypothetical protein